MRHLTLNEVSSIGGGLNPLTVAVSSIALSTVSMGIGAAIGYYLGLSSCATGLLTGGGLLPAPVDNSKTVHNFINQPGFPNVPFPNVGVPNNKFF